MRFDIMTLFPELFPAYLDAGVVGRAFRKGLAEYHLWNPRDDTGDVHQTVDDRPFGGGPGMVMKFEPLERCLERVRRAAPPTAPLLYLSPQGRRFNHREAQRLAQLPAVILLAGRYEGIDERFIDRYVDEELSVGDYVLSGGELPALVLIDAVMRLQDQVLGHRQSACQDSFYQGLLDCPQYTRPAEVRGMSVPDVLLGGNHQQIRHWRLRQSLLRTRKRRPDLLASRSLSQEERLILESERDAD